jgi:DNA polymerase-3 subunit epsilon
MWTALRQRWFRQQAPPSPLANFLDAPLPARRANVHDLEFVALDLEMTGLNPRTDQITSLGYVLIQRGRVCLKHAHHRLVRIDGSVEQSATLHGIVDADLADAASLEEALSDLLDVMAGRVLVLHHAPLDLGFLNTACRKLWGAPLVTRVVDTLALAHRRHHHGTHHEPKEGELRLHALRAQYGLPRYPAHNALSDALATAELFLALVAHRAGHERLPLRALLR